MSLHCELYKLLTQPGTTYNAVWAEGEEIPTCASCAEGAPPDASEGSAQAPRACSNCSPILHRIFPWRLLLLLLRLRLHHVTTAHFVNSRSRRSLNLV